MYLKCFLSCSSLYFSGDFLSLEQCTNVTNPCNLQILGRKVVIWYDKQLSKWQTFVDMCPHRLAPLSEGRIDEQGCLQCCYHGWSFKGDGSCARIPQAQPEGPEAKATGEYEKNHHLLKWYSARIVSCTK
jgi:phenylpropionate dioxygenase-like ring-hydroxylating dioxygenase large terminal subunit